MTCGSPLWASEGWVIPEVASFKEEGMVTKERWDWERGKLKISIEKVGTTSLISRYKPHLLLLSIVQLGVPVDLHKNCVHWCCWDFLTYLEILCWLLQDTGEKGRKAARKRRLQHRSKQQQQPLLPLILPFIIYTLCPGYYTQTVDCFSSLDPNVSFCITFQLTPNTGGVSRTGERATLGWQGKQQSSSTSSRAGLKQHRQRGRAVKLVRPTPPLVFVSNFLAIHHFQASVSIYHSTNHITADFANVTFSKRLIFLLRFLAYF